jgi:hypothetical protein
MSHAIVVVRLATWGECFLLTPFAALLQNNVIGLLFVKDLIFIDPEDGTYIWPAGVNRKTFLIHSHALVTLQELE